jgi:hypothetical protein
LEEEMTHAHLLTIVVTFILFIITLLMQNKGKKIKVMQMVLRASYIFILATGLILFFSVFNLTFLYIVKAIVGIVMIGIYEMIFVWRAKGKPTTGLWIGLFAVCAGLFLLGFMLPMGIKLL